MRTIFFGTPTFAATILEYLLERGVEIVAVVTKPDKKRGRHLQLTPSPVKVVAERHQIPLYQPLKARDPSFVEVLQSLKAEVFVVAAYSEIFNATLLALPPKGCINVHASLLPKYRGAAPIERAVMAGEGETGVTIMAMALELDAGEMLGVVKTPITDETTSGDLYLTLAKMGGEALYKVLQRLEQGNLKRQAQDVTQVCYAPKVSSEEGEVRWDRPAEVLFNHVRGLTPKPGAWCWVTIQGHEKRLLLKKVALERGLQGLPGEILPIEGLVVACGQGALRLLEVQLEGKNKISIGEFLRGFPKEKLEFKLKK